MNSAKGLLFTLREIETAMAEVLTQIPVTFDCTLYFSENYIEVNQVRIAYKGCICSVALKEPKEKSAIIAQFKAETNGHFEEKIWRSETDNVIARIAKINRGVLFYEVLETH